jgi:hypothetical protein
MLHAPSVPHPLAPFYVKRQIRSFIRSVETSVLSSDSQWLFILLSTVLRRAGRKFISKGGDALSQ